MTLTLQESGESERVTRVTLQKGPNFCVGIVAFVGRSLPLCAATLALLSSHIALMARGKGKAKQNSLRAAGMLPMLKKPTEAVWHVRLPSFHPSPTNVFAHTIPDTSWFSTFILVRALTSAVNS